MNRVLEDQTSGDTSDQALHDRQSLRPSGEEGSFEAAYQIAKRNQQKQFAERTWNQVTCTPCSTFSTTKARIWFFESISLKRGSSESRECILTIFESLKVQDCIALVAVARRVNVIYTLTCKEKNTTQLHNQIKHLESVIEKRLFLLKGMIESFNLISKYAQNDKKLVSEF